MQQNNVIVEDANPNKKTGKDINPRWWTLDEKELYKHLNGVVNELETRQAYRTLDNIKYARLYGNLEVLGLYRNLYFRQQSDPVLYNRVSLNVIKACIDTAASKIAKSKPRPMFLTEGGNWPLQKKAMQLTKFIDGSFQQMNLYQEKQKAFVDGEVFGTGGTKFYKDKTLKRVCAERVIIEEIMVDDAESVYGKPPNLYQKRLVNKETLAGMFPKHRKEIMAASNGLNADANTQGSKDLVRVIEAWHLPSNHGAGDGVHAIIVDSVTLLKEAYKLDRYPFTFDRWSNKLVGFFGSGIAEELIGIQIEINKILKDIQLSMHLFAKPRVFVENNSEVNLGALNNDIAAIVKYSGVNPPTFHTPQAMSPDVYNHLWNLYNKAFEITGISQLSATSQKPSGLDSAVALREYQDIESDRFQLVGQRWEESFLDSAKITIALTKELDEELDGGVQVQVSDKGSMKKIKWKDVGLKEDEYILKVFPASLLPTQPAGKLAKVTEMMQAGVIDKETGTDLLDFPDIEAATSKILAPRRIVFMYLDKILEDEKYMPPEPYFNLPMTELIANQYYLDAKIKGVPENLLEYIRTFIKDTQTLIQKGMPPMPPMVPGAGGGAAPTAVPQAPPTSDILPIQGV